MANKSLQGSKVTGSKFTGWHVGLRGSSGGGGSSDPYFANVVSLLHFDGAVGSSTITDVKGLSWATSGSTPTLTDAQKQFGPTSMAFPTNAVITATPSTPINLGDDFTIEGSFWTGSDRALFQLDGLLVYISGGRYYVWNGTANILAGGYPVQNTWKYVSLLRKANELQLWSDGVEQANGIYPYNMSSTLKIGYYNPSITAPLYVDEFRATFGVARDVSIIPTAEFPNS